MPQRHVMQMSTNHATYGVCVLGTEVFLDTRRSTPKAATSFDVHATSAVTVHIIHSPTTKPMINSRWPLDPDIEVVVTIDVTSRTVNDNKVKISYYGREGNELAVAWLYLTCVDVSLDVDWSRSGRVKSKGKDKAKWTWGPDGHGAVLLVNCDRDSPGMGGLDSGQADIRTPADLKDMSIMLLRTQGPSATFAEYQVVLHISETDADKVRVFHAIRSDSHPHYKPVLGPDKLSYVLDPVGSGEDTFYVEGLAFPDRGFSGLVSFSASLLEVPHKNSPGTPIFTDTVVFRVAPWIMTPNTQQPLEVFVCSIKQGSDSNEAFLEGIKVLLKKANCKLTICSEQDTRSDRWIQDELEFGYVEAPHKTFPVVFDSPRNRGLKDFAFKKILGPDFGYVTREPPGKNITSLDSFGNLDVSPPVTVRGKEYPLGRILIGSPLPWAAGRRMSKAVRDFLYAQKVQAPVEVYSEWLSVGHVDEFLTFVPAFDRKGFRLLLASPNACYKLFKEKQRQGHGEATQFIGLKGSERRSIDEILADESLKSDNRHVQRCIDWNRDLLKQELGLSEQDIIDIPQLFILMGSRADALFPDMVNMLVLGRHLGIPKPFGPVVGGQCCLEQRVRELLEPLGLTCTFIDDYFSYHVLSGDVHCGTNVRRKPFPFKWWHVVP
ncbi:protein-arginine deiminase type-1-like isoform X1 [Chiroxiphia lanceolata]|uniref:protein-arginine deiminase type-1-like isoform X1 n=1 Tax=Chiroxiphia lanceolata TaxID=296741 RepID=UPI0013CE73A1|nr:protein-arginine deiminase type-1-like isoform X1 [Chiroxiphia lanceolata]XP_032564734.1 protein-arginine deiminase type-1-like isoform X1 [Chiroxiphia lanceolata]XP_032564735.1 protein-arginine deiminase type-1-like isoform X1 [Chiroxiphia lanceolata]XP_032564736.1 protein-arginine deiminase type-1-like isoform X1 [Chiroxiphia lanceolata]XP_032564737.1 protein-arginine deiminase type-1-like isoform X1 [Chiroxiphia lanceolata]